MKSALILLAGLGLILLALGQTRRFLAGQRARIAAQRGWYANLPSGAILQAERLQPSGFPRLAILWQDRPFDLQVLPDSLTTRKLPALWLMVTLTAPVMRRGEIRIMARASGLESFSTFVALPRALPRPDTLPDHLSIRASETATLPGGPALKLIATLFADPRLKEVVLGDKGLRLTWLAEEADRGRYLIYREAELGRTPPDGALFERLLNDLRGLEASLTHDS